jgi:membrane-associated protease RseP (regulator of RpoE activity)
MDLIGWVIFVVALLVSVMLHETGHFVLAKRFGMKVTRYFVGFGPTLWSTRRGETEYGIKALPFGGFVKIVGMHSLDDPEDPADEPRSFRRAPAWQRIAVLCAGSFMHFLLAFLLVFGLALGVGIENDTTTRLGPISTCVPSGLTALSNGTCTAKDQVSPASQAGLRDGDTVVAFNGQPVSNWNELGSAIRQAPPGSPATITVRRDGKLLTLHTTLASVSGRSGAFLGIEPAVVFQVPSPLGAVSYAGSAFGQVVDGSVRAGSVVQAAEATGAAVAANWGWQYKVSFVLLLIASLNIFVGLVNMLPLLPMDGGHVAVIVYERIRAALARLRGRPDPGLVDMAKLLPVSFSLFMVIILVSVLLVLADIVNPVNLVGG